MVVGAFPIAKLGMLFMKQLSKPIANYAKNRAKSHPFFRKYICMPPAQFYNWCEIQAKMWLLNLGKPVNVPPLNEAMAIELGANLLGEGILFGIAALILIYEYRRQSAKQASLDQKHDEEMSELRNKIHELEIQQEQQRVQIESFQRRSLMKLPWSQTDAEKKRANINVQPEIVTYNNSSVINLALAYIEDTFYRENGDNDTEEVNRRIMLVDSKFPIRSF